MSQEQPNNPLHGVTLKAIVEAVIERHGWPELARRIHIRCFTHNPSLASSLAFLRRNDWARTQVEQLHLADLRRVARNRKRNAERAAQRAHRADRELREGPARTAAPAAKPQPSGEKTDARQ